MSFIMVPPCANAELGNQSIREKAIVVETDAIGVLKARPFKIALGWSAGYTEYRRLENCRTLVAKSCTQAIFVGNVGIYFGINEIRIFVEGQQCKIVVRGACSRWNGRPEIHEFSGDGVNQGRGNDVGATSNVGADRIERIHRSSVRTWYRGHAGGGRGDELLAARAAEIRSGTGNTGHGISAKWIVDVAVGRILLTRWQVFYRG